jgi:hypothetical protein
MVAEPCDVVAFPVDPRRLRPDSRLRTQADDPTYPQPEPLTDRNELTVTVLAAFGNVVQERGDRFVLIAAVLEHQGGHRHRVRDIGNRAALPELAAIDATTSTVAARMFRRSMRSAQSSPDRQTAVRRKVDSRSVAVVDRAGERVHPVPGLFASSKVNSTRGFESRRPLRPRVLVVSRRFRLRRGISVRVEHQADHASLVIDRWAVGTEVEPSPNRLAAACPERRIPSRSWR